MNIDTSELKGFAQHLNTIKDDLGKGKKEFLKSIDKEYNIEEKLNFHIKAEVYSKDEPEFYQRTERLLAKEAKAIFYTKDKMAIAMNDDWLEGGREHQYPLGSHVGNDPNVHGVKNPFMTYSERVEYGYTYDNTEQNIPFKIKMDERPFMRKTYEMMVSDVKRGLLQVKKIINPFITRWR